MSGPCSDCHDLELHECGSANAADILCCRISAKNFNHCAPTLRELLWFAELRHGESSYESPRLVRSTSFRASSIQAVGNLRPASRKSGLLAAIRFSVHRGTDLEKVVVSLIRP
jgi:hypothetical protein